MAQIKVKYGSCRHQFYMEDWETKSCPKCGKVTMESKETLIEERYEPTVGLIA